MPAIVGFVLGVCLLQLQAELPSAVALGALALLALPMAWMAARRRGALATATLALAGFFLGFAYAGHRAAERLHDWLPTNLEGRDLEVVGMIAGLPERLDFGQRFVFAVEQAPAGVPSRLLLSWPRDRRLPTPELAAGERWRLVVRLKRPHGTVNPHGFDYEAWLLERAIGATGTVRARSGSERLDDLAMQPMAYVHRLRQTIRARFEARLAGAEFGGVLTALAIGDQQAIPTEQWRLFARSGITHLMSISGLHVTMIAALAGLTFGALWRSHARPPLLWPVQRVRALAALLTAGAYTLLAGAGIPAQRTFFMLAVVALALFSGREIPGRRVLAAALLAVLLIDPWAMLAPGFWLSFGCVALLFFIASNRLGTGHWLIAWGRAQWAVTLGMMPVLLALFGEFSLVSPLANALAIPLVSLIVTPLALLAMLPGLDFLLLPAHWLTAQLLALLAALTAVPWAVWQQAAAPLWAVLLGVAGAFWLLLPRGFPARWLGAMALLPLFLLPVERPAVGELRATVLDVGQGLAVHLQTAQHDLLFDAGPAVGEEGGAGRRIVLPYLRAIGVRALDALILSHADRDHSGGAEAVVATLPVAKLIGALPFEDVLSSLPLPWQPCVAGEHWHWDGVEFQWLHPPPARAVEPGQGNATSCVLRVAAAGQVLLLAADIGVREEAELVHQSPELLRADVLVAPHHGGASGSSPAFVAAVGAREVIFSAGYRNRFGHPRAEVLARYVAARARPWRTDRHGALSLSLSTDGVGIEAARLRQRRYWRAALESPQQ